jgi:hypothetical protein
MAVILKRLKIEAAWFALLLVMTGGWWLHSTTTVHATSCYYDSYFNWCFHDMLPHDCDPCPE